MSATGDGVTLLRALKRAAGPRWGGLVIPVSSPGTGVEAYLRPVGTVEGRVLAEDLQLLSAWRNANVSAFLSEFEATPERTLRWLTTAVAADDGRILFMIDDPAGATVGYMGMAFIDWQRHEGEADAIVRGQPGRPGLMHRAMSAMFAWAEQQLGLIAFGVRVRSDNPALRFYERFGFVEERRVALAAVDGPGERHWVEATTPDLDAPALVHMRLERPSP